MKYTLKKIKLYQQDTDVKQLADEIVDMIEKQEFYEVRFNHWYMYSEASNLADTSAEDLVYESAGNYETLADFVDEHPKTVWHGDKELIHAWILYLYSNDFLS